MLHLLTHTFLLFRPHALMLLAEAPIGAERKSLGMPVPQVDSPWLAPPALVFYIFLVPIIITYGIQFYKFLKQRHERLQMADEQQEMHEQHQHFVANISHEIRTPLTLISAPLKELVANNSLNEHDRALLGIMQRNVTRLNQLAEQILNNSNHGKDDRVLRLTFGDVSAFVESIVGNFRFYAHEKNLHLTFDSKTDGQQGYFDMEKVEKIVSNLMSNAMKYTPEGGDVVVRICLDKGNAVIVVKDTGIGVTGSRQREMFRRFNRLDVTALQPSSKGFGVGLHYAQCLAFLHHGRLTYEPNVPQGSRFTLSIPYDKAAENDVAAPESNDPIALPDEHHDEIHHEIDEHLSTLLLVEDDYEMRAYIQMLLEDDYNVVTVSDGEEALETLKLNVPDLIISDVVMHRMDGFDLCRHIKDSEEYGYLPVLLLTAKSDLDNRRHGIDCGADAYIGKPFDPYYLKSVVCSILENRQRIQRIIRSMTHIDEAVAISENDDTSGTEPIMSQRDKDFLARFHRLLSDHLADENLNVTTLAAEMNLSYSSLYARVKELTGQSPQVFLNTYRMNIAMELLQTHNYTVAEVCYKVGASSPANFARSFKKQFGMVPSAV